jgi:putative membrane protein
MRTKLTPAIAAFFLIVSPALLAQSPKDKSTDAGLAGQDLKYFNELALANLAEVETGKLAESKASAEEVKKFARQMIADHGKKLEELQGLAKAKGVELPKQPKKDHQAALKKLESLSGERFDRTYMEQMVKEHEKTLKLVQDAAKNAKDPQLKASAEKTLPEIQKHLEMARQIAGR